MEKTLFAFNTEKDSSDNPNWPSKKPGHASGKKRDNNEPKPK